jgi:mono/diheme cytochrome c family protein
VRPWQASASPGSQGQSAHGNSVLRRIVRSPFRSGLLVAGAISAIFVGWRFADTPPRAAASSDVIAQGRQVYADRCAACHGADLEGQPDWRSPLASGRSPAPPHDESGHTWHHSDEVLFRIVKEGTAAVVGGGYESDMPGFAEVLNDAEIRAVLEFIKSTWPERERLYQEAVSKAE